MMVKTAKFTHPWLLLTPLSLLLSACISTSTPSVETDAINDVSAQLLQTHSQNAAIINDELDNYLSEQGRSQFLRQSTQALESDRASIWQGTDRATRTRWQIDVQAMNWQAVEAQRFVINGVDVEQDLEFVDLPYRSQGKLNLRSAPDIQAQALRQLEAGEVFNVLAKVVDKPWLLIEQQDIVIGYVHQDYVTRNVNKRDWISTYPKPIAAGSRITATSDTPEGTQIQGLYGIYNCRQLHYRLENRQSSERDINLCRKAKDIWYIESLLETNSAAPTQNLP